VQTPKNYAQLKKARSESHNLMDKIKIFIAGDFCPINRLAPLLTADLENHHGLVKDILKLTASSDFFIVNLECPLTNAKYPIEKCGALIKSDPNAAKFLTNIGVNLVTLANNHIMDYGDEGLADTLKASDKARVAVVGAAMSFAEATKIYYHQIKHRTLAVINMAEKEFSYAKPGSGGANPFDVIAAAESIYEARKQADHVLLIIHGGLESVHYPSPESVRILRFLADQGPTAIIRHHPHQVQGHEVWKGVPIFYSLGNFLFDWNTPINDKGWYEGIIVELTITESDDCYFEIHPFNQCSDDSVIEMLVGAYREQFMIRYHEWSAIIEDAFALQGEWNKLVETRKRDYFGLLVLPHNFLLRVVRKIGLLPFIRPTRIKRLFLENFLRCDAHREVLLNILELTRKQ
jgi:poly-gamma-glutamate capsule biosynthesis protein CapA/YwtB (metallophosphatase superfamily)